MSKQCSNDFYRYSPAQIGIVAANGTLRLTYRDTVVFEGRVNGEGRKITYDIRGGLDAGDAIEQRIYRL